MTRAKSKNPARSSNPVVQRVADPNRARPIAVPEWLEMVAEQLVDELRPVSRIKDFTDNTDLIGAYTEAAIRRLISGYVTPMRVCEGAVIDNVGASSAKQLDTIIWAPFPAPALFNVGGFGLVPKSSAFGVMEIKRTNYSRVDRELKKFMDLVSSETIVASRMRLTLAEYEKLPGLGVVCLLTKKPSAILEKLFNDRQAVAIFENYTDGTLRVRTRDVLILINFLQSVAWLYRLRGGMLGYPELPVDQK